MRVLDWYLTRVYELLRAEATASPPTASGTGTAEEAP